MLQNSPHRPSPARWPLTPWRAMCWGSLETPPRASDARLDSPSLRARRSNPWLRLRCCHGRPRRQLPPRDDGVPWQYRPPRVPAAPRRRETGLAGPRRLEATHASKKRSRRLRRRYGKCGHGKRQSSYFTPPHFCESFADSGRIPRLQNPFKYTRKSRINQSNNRTRTDMSLIFNISQIFSAINRTSMDLC